MAYYSDDDQDHWIKVSEPDYRGFFGQDRDRILYSSAFRRLAGKTQVVASSEMGDFHNRMTHSLKVAQLGRRLAQYLSEKTGHDGPDPDLIEAACLAHDLGHPPFGHAGEHALRKTADELVWARRKRISRSSEKRIAREFGGFEGNAQTLRILIRLSTRRSINSKGLDLTRAVLDATMKYPWLRQSAGYGAKKWNVYPDDLPYAQWIREGVGLTYGSRKCFEAEVMDWCDDVAYACHDVQDFYRAGLIPLDQFSAVPQRRMNEPRAEPQGLVEDFFEYVEKKWKREDEGKSDEPPFDREEVIAAWYELANLMLITGPYDGGHIAKGVMQQATSRLITYFFSELEVDGVPRRYDGKLVIPRSARVKARLLHDLIWFFVIDKPALKSQQLGQMKIVSDLVKIYYEQEDHYELMPMDRREDHESGVDYLRVCIDHVASMTELGAVAMHHRLTGTHVGSHSDGMWRV